MSDKMLKTQKCHWHLWPTSQRRPQSQNRKRKLLYEIIEPIEIVINREANANLNKWNHQKLKGNSVWSME